MDKGLQSRKWLCGLAPAGGNCTLIIALWYLGPVTFSFDMWKREQIAILKVQAMIESLKIENAALRVSLESAGLITDGPYTYHNVWAHRMC